MGMDTELFDKIPRWLASEEDDKHRFEQIRVVKKAFPAYPHDSSTCGHRVDPRIAPYLGHLGVMSMRDFTSILSDAGMTTDEANTLIEEAVEELRRPGSCSVMKIHCVYAVKKGVAGKMGI
jgi:hypothetical protein